MAAVLVRASLPSVRLGLAAMLREAGHDVLPADDPAASSAVQVVDGGLALLDLPTASAVVGEGPPAGTRSGGFEPLSPRELQVLHLLADGLPNKGIARALGISENTAKFHVAA